MKKLSNLTSVSEVRIKLYPENFEATRDFYGTFLGFKVVTEWNNSELDRGVMFDVGGTILELLARKADVKVKGADMSLEVADVRKLWEELKTYPKIAHAIRENSWGDTSFAILDPEGSKISFFTKV